MYGLHLKDTESRLKKNIERVGGKYEIFTKYLFYASCNDFTF